MALANTAMAQDGSHKVTQIVVKDRKAVFATVESVDVILARSRLSGTVAKLLVDEGSPVKAGQIIARIVDEKIAFQIKSLNARVQSLMA